MGGVVLFTHGRVGTPAFYLAAPALMHPPYAAMDLPLYNLYKVFYFIPLPFHDKRQPTVLWHDVSFNKLIDIHVFHDFLFCCPLFIGEGAF